MQTSEIRIIGLAHDGRGVGRVEGRVVFVPGLIPGDDARILVTKTGKSFDEAVVEEILSPSHNRVTPFCPFFGVCGGCSLQHMSYAAQLDWKRQRVTDALERIGKIGQAGDKVHATLGMTDPFFYRFKVSMPIAENGIGFYHRHSHDVVVMDTCAIQQPTGLPIRDAVWKWMKETGISAYDGTTGTGQLRHLVMRSSRANGEVLVTLVAASRDILVEADSDHLELPEQATLISALDTAVRENHSRLAGVVVNIQPHSTSEITGDEFICVHGVQHIQERLHDLVFTISAASFFQINPEMAEIMFHIVAEYAIRNQSDPVVDLYSGTGTISCFLARKSEQVTGIESVEQAVRDAEHNAAQNDLSHRLTFRFGLSETILNEMPPDAVSTVVLDPPRKGCAPELLDAMIERQPERIVYVSCEPSTMARDVRRLCDNGYEVRQVQPVDMFPWTEHVETVVLMLRVKD